jgi:hypothetical protein
MHGCIQVVKNSDSLFGALIRNFWMVLSSEMNSALFETEFQHCAQQSAHFNGSLPRSCHWKRQSDRCRLYTWWWPATKKVLFETDEDDSGSSEKNKDFFVIFFVFFCPFFKLLNTVFTAAPWVSCLCPVGRYHLPPVRVRHRPCFPRQENCVSTWPG